MPATKSQRPKETTIEKYEKLKLLVVDVEELSAKMTTGRPCRRRRPSKSATTYVGADVSSWVDRLVTKEKSSDRSVIRNGIEAFILAHGQDSEYMAAWADRMRLTDDYTKSVGDIQYSTSVFLGIRRYVEELSILCNLSMSATICNILYTAMTEGLYDGR